MLFSKARRRRRFFGHVTPGKKWKKSLSNTESRMQKRKICNTKGDPGRHHKRNHSSLKPAWSCIPIRLILYRKFLRNWKAIEKQKKLSLIDCKWPRMIKSGPGVLKGGPGSWKTGPGSLKNWPRLGHLWKSGPAWITPKNTTFSYSGPSSGPLLFSVLRGPRGPDSDPF